MPYEEPPIINIVGGIDLNGREGVRIEFGIQNDDGVDIVLTDAVLYFEVEGLLRKLLTPTDPPQATKQLLTITQGEVVQIWNAGVPAYFGEPTRSLRAVVRMESVTPPQVYWEPVVTIRGFIEEP